MNLPPSQLHRPPNVSPSPVFIPHELIPEVLSFLPVKSLLRLRCVNKSWNSLISDSTFVKLHLHRSTSRNSDITILSIGITNSDSNSRAVSLTVFRLFENPPIITRLPYDPYYQLNYTDFRLVVGSCNGLICLFGHSCVNGCIKTWLRFCNPATRRISEKFEIGCDHNDIRLYIYFPFTFAFGYDDSTDTYKVVSFEVETTNVRVFSLGDNVWRNIQDSPVAHNDQMDVVHLSSSVIWLAIRKYTDDNDITIKQFVITSLDLCNETHSQIPLPEGFDEVSCVEPTLSVLKDCLCFSHDFKQTHIVIWKMEKFGVEESWTQFLKIGYHNLQIDDCDFSWLPLCLSKKSDTLLLTDDIEGQAILYNWRDNRVEGVNTPHMFNVKDYVESLVWYC